MKLSRPKQTTWWIAVILGALGIIGNLGLIDTLGTYAFWLVAAGFVLLVLATLLNDL